MGMRDDQRTIMVRMDRTTHERLTNLRSRLVEWALLNPEMASGRLLDDKVSLSAVVDLLIDKHVDHARRSRRSKRRQRQKTKVQCESPG